MASSLGPVDRKKKAKLNALIKEWKARYKESGLSRQKVAEQAREFALAEMWMEARNWLPVWVFDYEYRLDYEGAEDDLELWERGDMFALGLILFGRPVTEDGWEVFASYSGQPHPEVYDWPLDDINATRTPELDTLWGIVFDGRKRSELRWQKRQFIAEMVSENTPSDDIVEAYVLLSDEIHEALDEAFPTLLTPVGDVFNARSWMARYPELKDVTDLLVKVDIALGAR